MPEPVKTNESTGGRPSIADEQFWAWLDDMRPYLRQGQSLWFAMDKCGLIVHKDAIYEKYRSDVEFSEKIDKLQATVVELNNAVIFKTIQSVHDRIIEMDGKAPIDPQEAKIISLVAEKHRSSQPFYVSRTETAPADDKRFGKVINEVPTIEYNVPDEPKEAPKDVSQDKASDAGDTASQNPVQPDVAATPGVAIPN